MINDSLATDAFPSVYRDTSRSGMADWTWHQKRAHTMEKGVFHMPRFSFRPNQFRRTPAAGVDGNAI
jgi:hypothetical protein